MAVLSWLEATGLATWIRESPSVWALPTILTLHTFGLGMLVGASAVVNLRLLGVGSTMPLAPLRPLFGLMWAGFWLNAVTGLLLFAADATRDGTSRLFLAKLVFVAVGVTTVVLIKRAALDVDDMSAAPAGRVRLLAVLSLVVWVAAITAGRLIAYVK